MRIAVPHFYRYLAIVVLAVFVGGCSVPNPEEPECTASREVVKRFYSFHFGNEGRMSPEIIKERDEFLTPDLKSRLVGTGETKVDYFTAAEKFPRAFRVGDCSSETKQKTSFEVIVFWRDDTASEQKVVKVETAEINGKWLIDKVTN